MKLIHALILVVTLFPSCIYYIDQDPVCDPPQPIYHQLLTTEPDWCIYEQNDVVWRHSTVVNNQVVADAWYVYHSSEFPHTPPVQGTNDGEYGVDGCELVQWPW